WHPPWRVPRPGTGRCQGSVGIPIDNGTLFIVGRVQVFLRHHRVNKSPPAGRTRDANTPSRRLISCRNAG
ncbi:hypothetical protein, partial [Cutibacterium modestum]